MGWLHRLTISGYERRMSIRMRSWMYMYITTVLIFHGLEQASAMMDDTVWFMSAGVSERSNM